MYDFIVLKKDAQTVGVVKSGRFAGQTSEQLFDCAARCGQVEQNLAAALGRKILQAVAGGEACGQALSQAGNRAAVFPGQ